MLNIYIYIIYTRTQLDLFSLYIFFPIQATWYYSARAIVIRINYKRTKGKLPCHVTSIGKTKLTCERGLLKPPFRALLCDLITFNYFFQLNTAPHESLLKVVMLKHGEISLSTNSTFRFTVRWQKPLFLHSAVKHYEYKITKKNEKIEQVQRRTIDLYTLSTTVSFNPRLYFLNTP